MKKIFLAGVILFLMIFSSKVNSSNNQKYMLFLGASITSGFGLADSDSFPGQIQNIMDGFGINVKILNAARPGAASWHGLQQLQQLEIIR